MAGQGIAVSEGLSCNTPGNPLRKSGLKELHAHCFALSCRIAQRSRVIIIYVFFQCIEEYSTSSLFLLAVRSEGPLTEPDVILFI
jgi:hypothetical protein